MHHSPPELYWLPSSLPLTPAVRSNQTFLPVRFFMESPKSEICTHPRPQVPRVELFFREQSKVVASMESKSQSNRYKWKATVKCSPNLAAPPDTHITGCLNSSKSHFLQFFRSSSVALVGSLASTTVTISASSANGKISTRRRLFHAFCAFQESSCESCTLPPLSPLSPRSLPWRGMWSRRARCPT